MADAENPASKKNSDLPVRLASAIVMLVVAGTALWLGGWWWKGFIALVAITAMFELTILILKSTSNWAVRIVGSLAGWLYVGSAGFVMADLFFPALITIVGTVIAVDVGAYFAGRTIGGPKIAPSISPSKTWAGLFGGMVMASIWMLSWLWLFLSATTSGPSLEIGLDWWPVLAIAAIAAIAAQAGDFLESWLKRKAGAKDSSKLIPGHGGVLDRIDGLVPVALLSVPVMSILP